MRERITNFFGRTAIARTLRRLRLWNGLLILNYHRIGSAAGSLLDHELFSATPEDFRTHLRFIRDHFEVVTPDGIDEIRERPDRQYVMLTFDDGYRDNFELAANILREERVPATFFIATGFIDRPRLPWWDEIAYMARTSPRERVGPTEHLSDSLSLARRDIDVTIRRLLKLYKRTPGSQTDALIDEFAEALGVSRPDPALGADEWMTWDMLRQMHADGFTIGGHTVSHPVLANLSMDEQHEEIEGCKLRLEAELGVAPTEFSYPVGGPAAFDEVTRATLQYHGFVRGFSFTGGVVDLRRVDPFDIPRTAVERYLSPGRVASICALPQVFEA